MMLFDKVLKNGIVVNADGIGQRDIGIIGEKIAYIGTISQDSGEVINCNGLHILPGVIDSQVHFRDPGAEYKEDLITGSKAATMGGVTAIFDMPNTTPLTTTKEALENKVNKATNNMFCDFAFWVGGTHENASHISQLESLPAVAGIKVFMGSSTGALLVADDEGVASILSQTKRRAAFHSEDEPRLIERKHLRENNKPHTHPIWRDEIAAINCTKRLVKIAKKYNAAIHILHISTAEEIKFLKHHKDLVTMEATPHHLTFSSEDYVKLGSLIQMNPPIRDARHRTALWYGLQQGLIDVLGSDHAPHTLEEKAQAYPNSPSGMPGVQTTLPIMLDFVNKGYLTLEKLVDLTSHGPNRVFNICNKGRIAAGYDADFAVVDLKKKFIISNSDMATKVGWTPYNNMEVEGCVVGTMVRGHVAMWEGEIAGQAFGMPVRFLGV